MNTASKRRAAHRKAWQLLTTADRIVYALLLLICALSAVAVRSLQAEGGDVIVEVNGDLVYQGSLSDDRHLEVEGPIGTTKIEIDGRRVWVSASDCPQKICVATGMIFRAGEIIVCIPNKVVVKVLKRGSISYDAITG